MFILSMVFAIGAVGLNIITGYAGYISLGQGAFIGLGAYTVGICVSDIGGSPWVWVPVAGLVAGGMAALLGVVAMRARGHAFVILTIAFLFLCSCSRPTGTRSRTAPAASRCRSPPGASSTRTGPSTTR